MSYQKLATLLQTLAQKTEQSKIEWEVTSRGDSFQTSFPNYTVMIEPDGEDMKLSIIDKFGDIVEQARDTDFGPFFSNPYYVMKNIYETARRQAKGVDQALDEILDDLEGKIPF